MIKAALVLYEVTAKVDYLERARTWAGELHEHYWDHDRGGYFFTSDRTEALITRTRSASDDAVPNANGIMLGSFARLYVMTADVVYQERANQLIDALQGEALASIYSHATFFNSFEIWVETVQCILVGNLSEASSKKLAQAILTRSIPNRCLVYLETTSGLPSDHPAHGKSQIDGKPTLYICKGTRCSLPITDAGGKTWISSRISCKNKGPKNTILGPDLILTH